MSMEQALGKKVNSKIPKGAKTSEEWAEEWGYSASHMSKKLVKAVKNGLMESGYFRNEEINRPQLYYWPK